MATAVSHPTLLSRLDRKSILKYQTIESYASLVPMSGANAFCRRVDHSAKDFRARGRGPIRRHKQAIFSEQISFRAVRSLAVETSSRRPE